MSSTPGTIGGHSPEIRPQVGRSFDRTDTEHYMQPDVDTSIEQPKPTPTNPRSSKYDLRLNPKPKVMTITDIESVPLPSTERICTPSGNTRNLLWN